MNEKVEKMTEEWEMEPNHLEFEYKGFPCLIHRNPRMGFLCGYVGLPPGHPWHGKRHADIDVDVHGDLTYSDKCMEDGPICHKPKPGESEDVWWIGFDTGHSGDFIPASIAYVLVRHQTYRNVSYVRSEIEKLVEQATVLAPV